MAVESTDIIRYAKKALIDELYSSAIYYKLAKMYGGTSLSKKLLTMSKMEENHAKLWLNFLKEKNVVVRSVKISKFKVNFLALIFRILRLRLTLRLLELGEL